MQQYVVFTVEITETMQKYVVSMQKHLEETGKL